MFASFGYTKRVIRLLSPIVSPRFRYFSSLFVGESQRFEEFWEFFYFVLPNRDSIPSSLLEREVVTIFRYWRMNEPIVSEYLTHLNSGFRRGFCSSSVVAVAVMLPRIFFFLLIVPFLNQSKQWSVTTKIDRKNENRWGDSWYPKEQIFVDTKS